MQNNRILLCKRLHRTLITKRWEKSLTNITYFQRYLLHLPRTQPQASGLLGLSPPGPENLCSSSVTEAMVGLTLVLVKKLQGFKRYIIGAEKQDSPRRGNLKTDQNKISSWIGWISDPIHTALVARLRARGVASVAQRDELWTDRTSGNLRFLPNMAEKKQVQNTGKIKDP